MAIEIIPYTEQHTELVKAFNQRLKTGGATYQFPESHIPPALPKIDGRNLFQEYFVAVENGKDVRGAFVLQHQPFSFSDKTVSIAHYDLPISEGFVNKAYSLIGMQLAMNALKRQPYLFSLGIGGFDEPLAQLLQKLGWQLRAVPFYFKVHHPAKFLGNVGSLRTTTPRKFLLDFLALSGCGWIGIKLAHKLAAASRRSTAPVHVEPVARFERWADDLWNACKHLHSMCAVRDSDNLNLLYNSQVRDFIRLKITRGDEVLGWAVLLNTQMSGSKQFGNMRVGTIVDCLALRENTVPVIHFATRHLERAGVDLIVTNQADAAWGAALKSCGYFSRPSNYIFAASKKLAELLQPLETTAETIHLDRGDGGGPMNL
ncbi:MAG: hypothetical protein E5Y65_21965 [Mesorhizobium sp.]|uniref:hypothetical protein n=1 Tax=Mesorhizobium sp. TaxID=1871066 RepID=UPI00120570F7|nr:hypothetical protein [Mesorhizobium sp.]TIL75903.1 MAG: hypothetical protein E5Y70_03955 [Mesorhizobium sp.]TIL87785.1 MAG: hypothetical protein E5Y65_21965 [Mesorhizobium sp.]TIL98880.1 MAG: hypothetical protein E5Y64_23245 [Mesorhizobium sp.]TIN21825.1 MAG: hypothetical protein E5Y59_00890 [Mesorhizobium sp.]